MKALVNARIYDFESYIEGGFVLFDREIAEVGSMEGFKGAEEVIDCKGALVMPGLINCHTHIYSAFARGMKLPFNPKSFKGILEQLWWKLDRQLDRDAIYSSAFVYGIESIKSGVTSIIDHHASGLCIEDSLSALSKAVSDRLGMRGIYCFETSDRFLMKDCLKENLRFVQSISETKGSMFGMHASMTLSDESLERISWILGNMPIHIHVAESMDDVHDCYSKYGKSIIERLDSFGLLNKGSILAHCVHINEEEAALIAERSCYVALNPTSNMNNAVGLPDYELLKKHSIKCIIGSDGLGANITRDYLNILFAMKNRMGSPTKFSNEDLLQMIRNGYEYMSSSLNLKLGRIEKGYKADLAVVPYDPPTPMDKDNALGHLIFGVFDSFKPSQVWISGIKRLSDYKLTEDTEEAFAKAREEAAKVWKRLDIK